MQSDLVCRKKCRAMSCKDDEDGKRGVSVTNGTIKGLGVWRVERLECSLKVVNWRYKEERR